MELGYARVSTVEQNLDLQRDALTKAGIDPALIYEDKLSGARYDRPQLEACLNRLRKGDTLIVWKLDRVGRSTLETVSIVLDLVERGVNFRSLTDGINIIGDAPFARFQLTLLAAIAELERNMIRERTKAGKQAAAARGKFQGGTRLLGEEPHGEKQKAAITPQQVAAERALLQELAGRVMDGESLSSIVRDLKTRNILTANGGNWSVHTLRRTLSHERTAPILGEDLHQDMVRLFASPQARKRQGRASPYLLTGIIRCQCGARMYINIQAGGQGRPRYRCLHSLAVGNCRKVSVLAAPLEDYVTKEVIRWLAGPGLVVVRNRLMQLDRDLTETARRMRADEQELVELAKVKDKLKLSIQEWLALREPIEARIKAAREILDVAPPIFVLTNIPQTRKELEAAWESWDIDKRRQVLKASISRLVIHQTDKRGPTFDEDRVRITFVSDTPPFDRIWATEAGNADLLHQVATELNQDGPGRQSQPF